MSCFCAGFAATVEHDEFAESVGSLGLVSVCDEMITAVRIRNFETGIKKGNWRRSRVLETKTHSTSFEGEISAEIISPASFNTPSKVSTTMTPPSFACLW
jgi:hypothetical protein